MGEHYLKNLFAFKLNYKKLLNNATIAKPRNHYILQLLLYSLYIQRPTEQFRLIDHELLKCELAKPLKCELPKPLKLYK